MTTNDTPQGGFLTVPEAAARAGVEPQTVRRWFRDERVPINRYRVGARGVRVSEVELDAFLGPHPAPAPYAAPGRPAHRAPALD
jgi:excisionase family DNA binding protein